MLEQHRAWNAKYVNLKEGSKQKAAQLIMALLLRGGAYVHCVLLAVRCTHGGPGCNQSSAILASCAGRREPEPSSKLIDSFERSR